MTATPSTTIRCDYVTCSHIITAAGGIETARANVKAAAGWDFRHATELGVYLGMLDLCPTHTNFGRMT